MPERDSQEGTIEVSLSEAVRGYLGKLGELRDELDEATGQEEDSTELIGVLLRSFQEGKRGIDAATKQILGLARIGKVQAARIIEETRHELEAFCDQTTELLSNVSAQRREARNKRANLETERRRVLREITRLTDLIVEGLPPRQHSQIS